MSMTPVPISMRSVRAAMAASSGNGEASWRAKWWTRTYAPSTPSSSAATASSTVCTSASRPVRTCDPGMGCQCPKDRNPIRFSPALMTVGAHGRRSLFPRTTKPRCLVAGIVAGMRRIGRSAGIVLLALIAVFFVGRAVVEVVSVDPSDAGSYRDDWGGPTYLGVLGVHAGPGLLVLAALVWWWLRRKRSAARPTATDEM